MVLNINEQNIYGVRLSLIIANEKHKLIEIIFANEDLQMYLIESLQEFYYFTPFVKKNYQLVYEFYLKVEKPVDNPKEYFTWIRQTEKTFETFLENKDNFYVLKATTTTS